MAPEAIAENLHVERTTVWRDVRAIQDRLSRRVELAELYTIQRAFVELEQEWNEAWIVYHRLRDKQQLKTKDGVVEVELDDSFRKLHALDRIHKVIELRCRLAGYFSAKVLERITMIETAAAHGLRIERITYEEQMKLGVEELENNEGLARSEGLRPSDQH
jgi:hypothetical protein